MLLKMGVEGIRSCPKHGDLPTNWKCPENCTCYINTLFCEGEVDLAGFDQIRYCIYYTSTKSWRGYIFTSVCLCVCLSVCLSVCPMFSC